MTPSSERTASGQIGSVDPAELAKFQALAEQWWAPDGPFKALRKLNPVRLAFIRDHVADRFDRDVRSDAPLSGLSIVDIGCGGGLLAEPLARLGAHVTGIDAAGDGIAVARQHAEESGLTIDYRETTAEALAKQGEQFDVVLAMEILEHVADPDAFLKTAAGLVRPGGMMIVATLNRTSKAFLMAIVGAEYVLRWVPRGTHDWRRFLRPSEVARSLRDSGLTIADVSGVAYNPLTDAWRLAPRDTDVNYMLCALGD